MARVNSKRNRHQWSIRKCNPTSIEVHARGNLVHAARRLADVLPAIRIVKDSRDIVVLKLPHSDAQLKKRVIRELSGA